MKWKNDIPNMFKNRNGKLKPHKTVPTCPKFSQNTQYLRFPRWRKLGCR